MDLKITKYEKQPNKNVPKLVRVLLKYPGRKRAKKEKRKEGDKGGVRERERKGTGRWNALSAIRAIILL